MIVHDQHPDPVPRCRAKTVHTSTPPWIGKCVSSVSLFQYSTPNVDVKDSTKKHSRRIMFGHNWVSRAVEPVHLDSEKLLH